MRSSSSVFIKSQISNNNDIIANMSASDRGKVVGGLPDVVTIMEKKVPVEINDWFISS